MHFLNYSLTPPQKKALLAFCYFLFVSANSLRWQPLHRKKRLRNNNLYFCFLFLRLLDAEVEINDECPSPPFSNLSPLEPRPFLRVPRAGTILQLSPSLRRTSPKLNDGYPFIALCSLLTHIPIYTSSYSFVGLRWLI